MKTVLLATLGFTSLALCSQVHAVSPRQVIEWAQERAPEREILRRVTADKTTRKATIRQIANMRMAGVPKAVIDYMANIGSARSKKPLRTKSQAHAPSPPKAKVDDNERLTVAVAIRLAGEHRDSLSEFIVSIAGTRGQLDFTRANRRRLAQAKVNPKQIAALEHHNGAAVCLYTSDCIGGVRCSHGGCEVASRDESKTRPPTNEAVGPVQAAELVEPRAAEDKPPHRFGRRFVMGGLSLVQSKITIPATPSSEEHENTEWNGDLAVRLAFVTPSGFYFGGRIWYDTALAEGGGDGSGGLLLGYLKPVSEHLPIFVDLRADVSRAKDEFVVSVGVGLAVAFGEEHPIFLHTELVSLETGGATSRGNVSLGIRFN